jgi:hypothetical protein
MKARGSAPVVDRRTETLGAGPHDLTRRHKRVDERFGDVGKRSTWPRRALNELGGMS